MAKSWGLDRSIFQGFHRTIQLKKANDIREELPADVDVYPGQAVAVNAGDATLGPKFGLSTGSGGPVYVVIENEHYGENILQPYKAGEPVQAWLPGPGDVVYGRVSSADSTVAVGTEFGVAAGLFASAATDKVGVSIGEAELRVENAVNFYFVPIQIR
jgi:hypothetical protein